MALDRGGRVALVVCLVVVVGAAFLLLGRQRAPLPDPVEAIRGVGLAFFAAPDVTTATEVPVALLCAPEGKRLQVVGLEPVGGSGEVLVTDFAPMVVSADCASEDPVPLVAQLVRSSGEAASVDAFAVTYTVDGVEEAKLVDRAITLCRQLSEC